MGFYTASRRNRRAHGDSFAMVAVGALIAIAGAFLFGSAVAPIWNVDVYGADVIRNALAFTGATFAAGGALIAFVGAVSR